MDKNPQYAIGNYLLFLFDQIGVSEQLRKWKDYKGLVDQDPDWDREFQKSISDTAQIRSDFDAYRKGANNKADRLEEAREIVRDEPEMWIDIEATRDLSIGGQSFSDTNIWYVQASDPEKRLHCRQMLSVVLGACGVFLQALHRGQFCRGAIAFGVGTDALQFFGEERDEIFGPVLEQAHVLESEIAVYPRVVIEETLLKFVAGRMWDLDGLEVGTREYATKQFENLYLTAINKLVTIDDDGCFILDYAGKSSSEQFKSMFEGSGINRSTYFEKIISNVKSEWILYAKELKKPHIADKYAKLYRYLVQCQRFWKD